VTARDFAALFDSVMIVGQITIAAVVLWLLRDHGPKDRS
jgi:hypothetical protein